MRAIAILSTAILLGALYALALSLVGENLDAPLIAWPILTGTFAWLFWKYGLLKFAGFMAAPPLALLAFELIWSIQNPGMNAQVHMAFDRSHYTPNLRVSPPEDAPPSPANYRNRALDILIGWDGFRADPHTGRGNPEKCRYALFGDSMIYGSGLPYHHTLGPVLADMGLEVCVFGVTGNAPVNYLATLEHVADRLEPDAHVVFYVYAKNDFISLSKYSRYKFLASASRVSMLYEFTFHFDNWRQGTWIHNWVHLEPEKRPRQLWQLTIGEGKVIEIFRPRNPAKFDTPKPLNNAQRQVLHYFLNGVVELSRLHDWRPAIVVLPSNSEIYAVFARGDRTFTGLDLSRTDSLDLCRSYPLPCVDIGRVIYQRSLAAGKNPYFSDDSHFSAFGTMLIAEHFTDLVKRMP